MMQRIFSVLLRIRRVYIMAGLLLATLIVLVWGLAFDAPRGFPEGQTVTIPQGLTTQEIAELLYAERVIESRTLFVTLTRTLFNGYSVKAGEYFFSRSVGPLVVAYRVSSGVYGVEPEVITIAEGLTIREIAERVEETFPHISAEDFRDRADGLEGYLFPNTYHFAPNVSANTIITTMEAEFNNQIEQLRLENSFDQPLSDIVIMASILEREARQFETQQRVAGILWERLAIGMPLQVDAVFGYIFDRETFHPSFADLEIDSPYNTYLYAGLPPGPINNPGIQSLRAAINPIESDYLFYLTGRDGIMYYGRTFEEHRLNRARYLD